VVPKLDVEEQTGVDHASGNFNTVAYRESSDGFLFGWEVMIQPWTATVATQFTTAPRCGAQTNSLRRSFE